VRISGHYVRSEAVRASGNRADDGRSRPPSGGASPILSSFRHVNLPLAPRKAGASRRKPTPARPSTVAREVMNGMEGSDQAITLRRRSTRMRRIDGLRRRAEMVQNPFNHCGVLYPGDDVPGRTNAAERMDARERSPAATRRTAGRTQCR
jgi:hypothetical protein